MTVLLALLLNAGLLAGLAGWLRRAYRQAPPELRAWLLPALAWRLVLTAANVVWPSADALHASTYGRALARQLWAHPARALTTLWQARLYDAAGHGREVYRWDKNLFFYKLVALLDLASGGLRWLNTLYLSLACFVAAWALVATLRRVLPRVAPAAALLAFLLWPTVLWWTGGLNKETVLVGAGLGIVALVLPPLYGPPAGPPRGGSLAGRLLALLLLAWVMTRVRYFFALPLLGGLLALAGVQAATRRGWLSARWPAQVGALGALLLLQLTVAKALGGRLMEADYFVYEVNQNYHHGQLTSADRPHIEYAHWEPAAGRLLAYVPLAVVQTLTRPWPGESADWLYVGAGLENVLLAGLLGRALLVGAGRRRSPLPAGLLAALLLYCLLLAAFIGLSTPNLGTLNRYRSVLLPWLLWLCFAYGGRRAGE